MKYIHSTSAFFILVKVTAEPEKGGEGGYKTRLGCQFISGHNTNAPELRIQPRTLEMWGTSVLNAAHHQEMIGHDFKTGLEQNCAKNLHYTICTCSNLCWK